MKAITKKGEVKIGVDIALSAYAEMGLQSCITETNLQLLQAKVKFPLLEYASHLFFENLKKKDHILFCEKIAALKTIGGNVLIGIILQNRLDNHRAESFEQAARFIDQGNEWYVCDIIGERVFGFSLLNNPAESLPWFQKFSKQDSTWVVRSLGAGGHYAVKKGLTAEWVRKLFQLLLSLANSKEKQIRQGIGWAAKTTAKFHPEIIEEFQEEINDEVKVHNWFRKKIEIGLNRNKYAKRD